MVSVVMQLLDGKCSDVSPRLQVLLSLPDGKNVIVYFLNIKESCYISSRRQSIAMSSLDVRVLLYLF